MHPHPAMIGSINPFLPLFDVQQVVGMTAQSGWGPMAGVVDTGEVPMAFPQVVMYDLPKVEG